MTTESQLRKVIELDGVSGRFELDEKGYTRLFPSEKEKADIERDLGEWIERAERENHARFDAQAENVETYSAVKSTLANEGGQAILPSPIARIPADQIIAATHNNIMRPRPIASFDPYFDAKYPVLMPSPEYDPNDPSGAMLAGIPPGTPMQIDVDAETISRRIEQGMDFICRERIGFEEKSHRVTHACVVEGYAWIKTFRQKKKRNLIRPKKSSALLIDVEEKEELEYNSGSEVQIEFVHDSNMLRPNLDQPIDELPWLAERIPDNSPDDVRAAYRNDEYFLIVDDEEAEKLASLTSATVDESKRRTDSSVRNQTPEQPHDDKYCDIREVWAYRWLKVKDEVTGESHPRRFMLLLTYHHGARKLMAAMRNPYNHQRRIHTVFSQFLDGSCTVGIVKYNQQIGTHLIQAEIKNAYLANNFHYRYDPTALDTAKFFEANKTIHPGTNIPGMTTDWDVVRAGAEHYSLLGLIQWNAGVAQMTSKVSDYEAGAAAPSHTSPNTVSMLLDRGGQQSVLFLRMLNRGWREVFKLFLETARQFQPLGEVIPIRNPKDKTITNVPFRYPIGEALDNFRFSLTAADEAMARERDPDQMAAFMDTYQRHVNFMMGPIGALINPDTTEEQAGMYRKLIEGGQALLDRYVSTSRVDEETFNIMPQIDSVIAEKRELIAQAKAAQEAANASNQNANGGGLVPPAEGAPDALATAGLGGESGVAGGAGAPSEEGLPVA